MTQKKAAYHPFCPGEARFRRYSLTMPFHLYDEKRHPRESPARSTPRLQLNKGFMIVKATPTPLYLLKNPAGGYCGVDCLAIPSC